jgi:hypothetical protein
MTTIFNYTIDAALYAGLGYIYSQQAKVSSNLMILIATVSRLAHALIALMDQQLADRGWINEQRLKEIYIVQSLMIDLIAIVALKYFGLIALTGTVVLSCFALLNIIDVSKAPPRDGDNLMQMSI